jgi:hypothetical protein
MPMQRCLTVEESSRAIGYLQTGLLQSQFGLPFNVSHAVIGRLWIRYQQTHNAKHRPKSGQSRSKTIHQDRIITLLSKRNRMSFAVTPKRDFCAVSGGQISTQTFRNRLHASGLHAKRQAARPELTAHHHNGRLQFARLHVN